MKRICCEYCGEKIDKKQYAAHLKKHRICDEGEFECLKGCVRCCTDRGLPLELTLGDIKRACSRLEMRPLKFFKNYCEIIWNRIPKTLKFVPSIALRFPCGFLKAEDCTIYEARPLNCRLFPENVFVSMLDAEPVTNTGYECIDKGFTVNENRAREIKKLAALHEKETGETAEYFENIKLCVELSKRESEEIASKLERCKPIEKNEKRRELCTNKIKEKIDEEKVKAFFEEKIQAV